MNRLIEDRGSDVGLSMLLVDFQNDFNLVDRAVMLREVRRCCPAFRDGLNSAILIQPGCTMGTKPYGHLKGCSRVIPLVLCFFLWFYNPWCVKSETLLMYVFRLGIWMTVLLLVTRWWWGRIYS